MGERPPFSLQVITLMLIHFSLLLFYQLTMTLRELERCHLKIFLELWTFHISLNHKSISCKSISLYYLLLYILLLLCSKYSIKEDTACPKTSIVASHSKLAMKIWKCFYRKRNAVSYENSSMVIGDSEDPSSAEKF